MKNEEILMPVIEKFYNKIKNEEFVIDKTGCKIVELICEKIELNPQQQILDFGVRKTNIEYCEREVQWYNSMNLNIEEISKYAKLWKTVCDRDGNVNSNYGWCVFSKENYNQYDNCLNELLENQDTRRAVMIYNRPSMWRDYNKNGKNDFICTFAVQCFIRSNRLIYVVNMRSCDFVYGLFSDFWWHCWIYKKLDNDLKNMRYTRLENGKIFWVANSLHLYEKHFDLIKKIYEK